MSDEIAGRRPEVLAPAGDAERLQAAIQYGADAVYLSGTSYGMRTASPNFDENGLAAAVKQAHAAGVKVYVTCNILPRNRQLEGLPAYLEQLQQMGVDAIIAADLGVIAMAKRYAPRCRLHISTQLGAVNFETVRQLHEMGAHRVVLARELSLEEIAEIRAKTDPALELECFVHGAMCMSYSGRCVISNYLTGRDANQGECTQPCRWPYYLIEPSRPGQIVTVEEDAEGTYLFNANDLNMIEHLPALWRAGVSSFKIEGRVKSAYYTAAVTNAYKTAVDHLLAAGCPADFQPAPWIVEELERISHRPYGTGFFFGQPSQETKAGGYIRGWQVAAVVTGYREGWLQLEQRNRFYPGEILNLLEPGKPPEDVTVAAILDGDGQPAASTNRAAYPYQIPFDRPVAPGAFLRRKVTE